MLLEGLLRSYERTSAGPTLRAVERTAEAMARGASTTSSWRLRPYSVDTQWVVPHFEKNALRQRFAGAVFYAHLARRTGRRSHAA